MKKWLLLGAVVALAGLAPVVADAQQPAPPSTTTPPVITVNEGAPAVRAGLFRGRIASRSSATIAPPLAQLSPTAPGETIVPVSSSGASRAGLLSRLRARR